MNADGFGDKLCSDIFLFANRNLNQSTFLIPNLELEIVTCQYDMWTGLLKNSFKIHWYIW